MTLHSSVLFTEEFTVLCSVHPHPSALITTTTTLMGRYNVTTEHLHPPLLSSISLLSMRLAKMAPSLEVGPVRPNAVFSVLLT